MFAQAIIAYLATAVVFFTLDFIWLGHIARDLYRREIGPLLLEQFNLPVAGGFYALYVAGIVVFAVWPALNNASWQTALGLGALFGLMAYGTYDLTNLATLKGWTVNMVLMDVSWGTALTGTSALAGYWITRAVSGG